MHYFMQGWAFCYKYAGRAAHVLFLLPLVPSVIVYRYWLMSYLLEINFPPGTRFTCCLQQVSEQKMCLTSITMHQTFSFSQLILIFKWISFVSENGRKVLYPWHKEDETGDVMIQPVVLVITGAHRILPRAGPAVWYAGQMEPQIGSFSSYVYFLFCPVLLYRDRYPRKQRNFRKATNYFIMVSVSTLGKILSLFLQFLVLVWVCYVILFEFGMPQTMQ